MAHVPLEKVYDNELSKIENDASPIAPEEMGVACRSINGGYVVGTYRKTISHREIIKRRERVEKLLKKYAL